MKQLKHLLVAALTFVMALAIAVPAFAAPDTSISVSDIVAGDEVNYYKVIEWKNGAWHLTDDFADLVGTDLGATEAAVIEAIAGTVETPGTITQQEADIIAGLAKDATATTETASGTTWTHTIGANDAGLYMIIIAAKSANIVYNPIFVGADFKLDNDTNSISATETYSNTAVAKKKSINVTKTASDADQEIKEAIDSKVGEIVDFEVDTTIPVYLASYQNPSFVITDAVTEGIELDPDTITVYLDDVEVTDPTGIFTIDPADETGYTITFDTDYLAANATPVEVHIEYSGEITNDATFNLNYDNNTVTVDYANGPGTEKGALKDVTNHYTFSLGAQLLGSTESGKKTYELIKVGVDENGDYVVDEVLVSDIMNAPEVGALKDAGFTLYAEDKTTVVGTCTTGEDGILSFSGLDAGVYYLKETTVPSGYVGDTEWHKVEIVATYSDPITVPETTENGIPVASYTYVVLTEYKVIIDGETTTTYTVTNDGMEPTIDEEHGTDINETEIDNTPGVQLPSTGGIGTTIFYVVGGAMVICSIVLLVTKRRLSQMEE